MAEAPPPPGNYRLPWKTRTGEAVLPRAGRLPLTCPAGGALGGWLGMGGTGKGKGQGYPVARMWWML
jgi:hypothetical protein